MATALFSNKFQNLVGKGNRQSVLEQKLSLTAKLFGCRHKNISRPFAQGETAYRCCLDCGARRHFNPQTHETYGSFYFPTVATEFQINKY